MFFKEQKKKRERLQTHAEDSDEDLDPGLTKKRAPAWVDSSTATNLKIDID